MEEKPGLAFRLAQIGAWIAVLFLSLPLLVAIPQSLTPERFLSFPKDEISWRHYETFFTSEDWLHSLLRSLLIAIIAGGVALLLGTAAAIALWRWSSRWSMVLWALLLTPMIVPPIVSALAFYRAWAEVDLLDTFTGVIIAHAVLAVPYVVLAVSASLANLDPALELAARGMGASLPQTVLRVIVPNIRGGILSGAVLAFILSWDEIVVTIFIASQSVITLPRLMWQSVRDNVDPTVAVCALVLTVVTILALSLRLILGGRRLAGR